jgi:hypothetical protein
MAVFRIRIGYMRIRIRILDECGSGSSADPDSGKIWTKVSEGKQNAQFFFSSDFYHSKQF